MNNNNHSSNCSIVGDLFDSKPHLPMSNPSLHRLKSLTEQFHHLNIQHSLGHNYDMFYIIAMDLAGQELRKLFCLSVLALKCTWHFFFIALATNGFEKRSVKYACNETEEIERISMRISRSNQIQFPASFSSLV